MLTFGDVRSADVRPASCSAARAERGEDLVDIADAGQLARLRLEARIVDGEQLAEALALVERAVPQVGARALPVLAERLGRAYSRVMARLHGEVREAVRARVREGS